MALVLLGAALLAAPSRPNELLAEYGNGEYAQNQMNVANGQQLAEFQVAGSMQTGEPAPQGIPLSFQLPVPLPAPSPPAPTVITVGGSPNKGPECKRCERQMRKIKVRGKKETRRLLTQGAGGKSQGWCPRRDACLSTCVCVCAGCITLCPVDEGFTLTMCMRKKITTQKKAGGGHGHMMLARYIHIYFPYVHHTLSSQRMPPHNMYKASARVRHDYTARKHALSQKMAPR